MWLSPDSLFRTGLSLPDKVVEEVFPDSMFRTGLSLPYKIVEVVFPGRQNVQNRIIPGNTKCRFLTALLVFLVIWTSYILVIGFFTIVSREACLLAVSTFKDILLQEDGTRSKTSNLLHNRLCLFLLWPKWTIGVCSCNQIELGAMAEHLE